jgi:hypothetical protein
LAIPTFKRALKHQRRIDTHEEVDNILDYLTTPDLARGAIAKISRDTGIPESTLRDWPADRGVDENWFPLSKGHSQARAPNLEGQAAIAGLLCENHIRTGIRATRTQLRHLCLDLYAEQVNDERHLKRLCASTTFLQDFETAFTALGAISTAR